jgi:hypothetical protein
MSKPTGIDGEVVVEAVEGSGGREEGITGLRDDLYVVESFKSIARLLALGVVELWGLVIVGF